MQQSAATTHVSLHLCETEITFFIVVVSFSEAEVVKYQKFEPFWDIILETLLWQAFVSGREVTAPNWKTTRRRKAEPKTICSFERADTVYSLTCIF